MVLSRHQLQQRQGLPLEVKIHMSQIRIREWYEYWGGQVYVSFSGGKDSTVLLHLVRSVYPHVPAVFLDTGLEYPEIRNFVKQTENVIWLKPQKHFKQVIEEYGYPVISKEYAQWIYESRHGKTQKMKDRAFKISEKWRNKLVNAPFKISHLCCDYLKKNPVKRFEKESGLRPYLGDMAWESYRRTRMYLRYGCNAFECNRPISRPLGFWTDDDIWSYICQLKVPHSPIYDMGYERTGCMFCGFGVHMQEQPNRFQLMAITHPRLYYYCMDKLGLREVLQYLGIPYRPAQRNEQPRLFEVN